MPRTCGFPGGAEGSRTPGLLNAIQALSQLSYGPTSHQLSPPEAHLIIRPACAGVKAQGPARQAHGAPPWPVQDLAPGVQAL